MCPRTNTQFESIRKEKRQLILDAALNIFANKGYHAASIATIAKEAGISKGLIYNYFNSKEEILRETLSSATKYMFKQYKFDADTLAKEQLTNLIELTFELLENDFSYWKIYFSVLMQTDVMELFKENLFEILIPVLEAMAIMMGKLGFENPSEEARFLGALLDGLSLNYITDPETFPKEYCINRLKSIYNIL